MDTLKIKRMGLAFGLTGALLYIGCVLVMATVGQEETVRFFNSLLHGLDTSEIIRMDVSTVEVLFGVIQTFVIAWFIGACIAAFYNVQSVGLRR